MYEVSWSAQEGESMTGRNQMKFHLMKDAREYYHKIIEEYKYNHTLKIALCKVTRTLITSKGH